MTCFSGVARLLLVIINIVFMLLGLVITALGLVLRYGEVLYRPFLKVGINELQEVLDNTKMATFKVEDINFGEYAIVIGVAFVAEAVGIGLLYGMPSLVKDKAKTSMSIYKGIASSEVYSLAWNVIMIQFQCCGVDSYRDFQASSAWEKHPIPNNPSLTLETPIACCKTLPSGTAQTDFMCAIQYNSLTSNGETGCYDALWKASFGHPGIAVPVLIVCNSTDNICPVSDQYYKGGKQIGGAYLIVIADIVRLADDVVNCQSCKCSNRCCHTDDNNPGIN